MLGIYGGCCGIHIIVHETNVQGCTCCNTEVTWRWLLSTIITVGKISLSRPLPQD
uniref:Uncharacterized protein n=1 Tax=Arundo donax TaxID=35708 RepID=A0A0A8Z0Q4_ARUDO